jgi:hypothetical protein
LIYSDFLRVLLERKSEFWAKTRLFVDYLFIFMGRGIFYKIINRKLNIEFSECNGGYMNRFLRLSFLLLSCTLATLTAASMSSRASMESSSASAESKASVTQEILSIEQVLALPSEILAQVANVFTLRSQAYAAIAQDADRAKALIDATSDPIKMGAMMREARFQSPRCQLSHRSSAPSSSACSAAAMKQMEKYLTGELKTMVRENNGKFDPFAQLMLNAVRLKSSSQRQLPTPIADCKVMVPSRINAGGSRLPMCSQVRDLAIEGYKKAEIAYNTASTQAQIVIDWIEEQAVGKFPESLDRDTVFCHKNINTLLAHHLLPDEESLRVLLSKDIFAQKIIYSHLGDLYKKAQKNYGKFLQGVFAAISAKLLREKVEEETETEKLAETKKSAGDQKQSSAAQAPSKKKKKKKKKKPAHVVVDAKIAVAPAVTEQVLSQSSSGMLTSTPAVCVASPAMLATVDASTVSIMGKKARIDTESKKVSALVQAPKRRAERPDFDGKSCVCKIEQHAKLPIKVFVYKHDLKRPNLLKDLVYVGHADEKMSNVRDTYHAFGKWVEQQYGYCGAVLLDVPLSTEEKQALCQKYPEQQELINVATCKTTITISGSITTIGFPCAYADSRDALGSFEYVVLSQHIHDESRRLTGVTPGGLCIHRFYNPLARN